jgi:UDP-N-acetylmuramate: L-alanyl-gamma-D-glutamyl-meso-diaminopimelate ligase
MTFDAKKIHLIAIGGTGMAALAGMLKSAGHRVSGSDQQVYPPMSEVLERQGISYKQGYRAENLETDTDLVIIGNAVSKTNPEVQEVIRRGLPYQSFPQALFTFFLHDRVPVVIAGTHGKTTTAAQMAWVLDRAGLEPGFLVGGWMKNFEGNSRPGKGRYFVVEGDEYDSAFFDKGPKFLHYRPHAAILTSIEFDHADIYQTLSQIKSAFLSFVKQIPADGILVAHQSDSNVREVTAEAACPVDAYGLDSHIGWRAESSEFTGEGVYFRVVENLQAHGEFFSPLAGRHNLLNTLSVIAAATRLGVPMEAIRSAVASFAGVSRRQEVVGIVDDVTVLDDFAHHPTAIRETLSGLRMQYPGRRLWAVFEPRSATSRRRVFQSDLPLALREADEAILAGLFAPEKIPPDQRLDPREVIAELVRSGGSGRFLSTTDEIVRYLAASVRAGDLVCIMSSGGFDGIHSKLLAALKNRSTFPPGPA